MITLIAAQARNRAIGRGNTIPWHIPEDFRLFQRTTMGGALIMGRRTWESLPTKPLKGRLNIVVSSDPEAAPLVAPDIDTAIAMASQAGYADIYGIGGAGIYAALLPRAQRLILTQVARDVPDADTFFPPVPPQEWTLLSQHRLREDGPACTVETYLRARPPATSAP